MRTASAAKIVGVVCLFVEGGEGEGEGEGEREGGEGGERGEKGREGREKEGEVVMREIFLALRGLAVDPSQYVRGELY